MPYLGRRVSPDKWSASPDLGADEVSADSQTRERSDIKTQGNKLSFYESADSELDAAHRTALALAANRSSLDPMFVACLDRAALEAESISFEEADGDTYVKDLKPLHRNAIRLDLSRLNRIAIRLAAAVRRDTCHMWTSERVRELLQDAVNKRRINLAELKPELRKHLREPIR